MTVSPRSLRHKLEIVGNSARCDWSARPASTGAPRGRKVGLTKKHASSQATVPKCRANRRPGVRARRLYGGSALPPHARGCWRAGGSRTTRWTRAKVSRRSRGDTALTEPGIDGVSRRDSVSLSAGSGLPPAAAGSGWSCDTEKAVDCARAAGEEELRGRATTAK